jgi:dATP pyrophosphohydrolase
MEFAVNRAPFQVLVFPYHIDLANNPRYAVFRRNDPSEGYWQGLAGGGEGAETPLEAAKREAFEEAGVSSDSKFIELTSTTTIPVINICGFIWGQNTLVVPEYAFGVLVIRDAFRLSHEHTAFEWLGYDGAMARLRWDSNKNALWELNTRLQRQKVNG